jgi:hypothetical protein
MALSATVAWDVRTTGSDSNGGGFNVGATGTDFSQQNSAQVAFTDLVIGGTNTQLTSAANPFSSASVGNIINITGGTGFTTGRYQVVSVSGATATMDRAVGTAASSGGTGNLGGSLATIGAANTASVASNSIYIQTGTYTLTSSINVAQSSVNFIGYQTTHGDNGTKPLITTATSSIVLFNTGSSNGGLQSFQNLSLSNTATTRFSAVWQASAHGTTQAWVFRNCIFDGFTDGIDNSNGAGRNDVANVYAINCEFKNCSDRAINARSNSNNCWIEGCFIHDGAIGIDVGSGPLVSIVRCIFSNLSEGINCAATRSIIASCTFFNAATTSQGAIEFVTGVGLAAVYNCLFYTNNIAIQSTSLTGYLNSAALLGSTSNAFGNSSAANVNWPSQPGDITLTADPFVSSATGNFALNTTAGGGAACRQAGFPGIFPGGTSTGFLDIGAVQTSGGAGGAGGAYTFLA